MNAAQRREQIARMLEQNDIPLSATAIAKRFEVSRQIVVGDIALLRASGADISATPRGYVLNRSQGTGFTAKIACRHPADATLEELCTIVDHGGAVLDVIVEHPVYGQLVGELRVFSRFDADLFVQKTKEFGARLLSNLTDGIHLHTVRCKDEAVFERILAALEKKGFLLKQE